jgi:hypothetical protein
VAYLRLKIIHITNSVARNTRSCFITCIKSFLWVIIPIIAQKKVMNAHKTHTTLYILLHFDGDLILSEIPPIRKADRDIIKRCWLSCLSHDISLFILLLVYCIRNKITYKLKKLVYYWYMYAAQINTLVLKTVYHCWQRNLSAVEALPKPRYIKCCSTTKDVSWMLNSIDERKVFFSLRLRVATWRRRCPVSRL